MADKITQSNELKLEMQFYDGDTRTIAVDNPKSSLTKEQIKAAGTTIKNANAFIGDKDGAAFVGFKTAKKQTKKITQLDLR